MNFYQQFRDMAKYTHDTLCKSERNLFYKDYYEKHHNDFSQIQEKDITFPNDKKMEAELKEIIEKIFIHEFWNKTEYTKQMISEYSKIINNKTTLQVRERIFETNNPGIAMFTFQFGETTKQFLPVNIFNYVCNLNDSIQRKYDSCFFIKEIFSSGKNRISNLFDDTNIEDKHIFNIFRKNIYHDFYNENIEKQEKIFNKEKQSDIIESKLDNINEHSNKDNIFYENQSSLASEILNKQEIWDNIIKAIDKEYLKIRLVNELSNGESFFTFLKNNISCTDLDRKKSRNENADRYKKLNNDKVIEIRAKYILLIIFNDKIKKIIKDQLERDKNFQLIDACAEHDYVLRQKEFVEAHNYTREEIIRMSIIRPFIEKLSTNERLYNLFKNFIERGSNLILNIF